MNEEAAEEEQKEEVASVRRLQDFVWTAVKQSKEEDQEVREARRKICSFARKIGTPWEATGALFAAIPSRWETEKLWARRTALATIGSATYALVFTKINTVQALAPILAVACIGSSASAVGVPCIGSVILIGRAFLVGCIHGAISGLLVVEATKGVFPKNQLDSIGAALFAYFLTVTACAWLCTRAVLTLTNKKLSIAILVFAVYPNVAEGFSLGPLYPLSLLVPCTVGSLCALLAAIFPSPVSAVELIRSRAAYHGVATRALLTAQHFVVLTYEPAALAQAETWISEIETNAAAMQRLLPLAHLEMDCTPRFPGYSQTRLLRARRDRLNALVGYLTRQLKALRGKQLACRRRSYRGFASMSRVQLLWMALTTKPWQDLTDTLCDLIDATVALETSLDGGVPRLLALQEEQNEDEDAAPTQNRSRIRELHATAFNTQILDAQSARLKRSVQEARETIFYKGNSMLRKNEDLSAVAAEHCRRMSHIFFFSQLTEVCRDAPNFLKTPSLYVDPWPFFLRGWGDYFRRLFFQSTSGHQLIEDLKKALSIAICGALVFIPLLRSNVPEATLASVTVAFIFTESSGDAFKTGGERVVGTLAGSVYAFIAATATSHLRSDWAVIIAAVLSLSAWTAFNALYFNFPNVVAAFTAAGIQVAVAAAPRDNRIHDAEFRSSHAIRMNALGALVFFFIETQVYANSSRRLIEYGLPTILGSLVTALEQALGPFILIYNSTRRNSPSEKKKTANHNFGSSSLPNWTSPADHECFIVTVREDDADAPCMALDTEALVTEKSTLLVPAAHEPNKSRAPFPKNEYANTLSELQAMSEVIQAMFSVARLSDLSTIQSSILAAINSFLCEARTALLNTANAWKTALDAQTKAPPVIKFSMSSGKTNFATTRRRRTARRRSSNLPSSGYKMTLFKRSNSLRPSAIDADIADDNDDDLHDSQQHRTNLVVKVAAPLVGFSHRALPPLVLERRRLMDRASEEATPVASDAIISQLATIFLCEQLALGLDTLCDQLRQIQAKELFRC